MSNGATIDLDNILIPDNVATELVNLFMDWTIRRAKWVSDKVEIQQYIFATDTKTTPNAQLPWKNKTTVPKLCQIRDNLYANYMAALFPKNKWLRWEGSSQDDQTKKKADAIENLMSNAIDIPEFKNEISKLVYDYIDYGNVVTGLQWIDKTQVIPSQNLEKVGYAGPVPMRHNPLDVVFNPIAPSFFRTGKFVRTLMSFGDFAKMLASETPVDNQEAVQAVFGYVKKLRVDVSTVTNSYETKNILLSIAGFTSFAEYLRSNYIEVLTYYGDFYDIQGDKLHQNKVITIVDRHKVVSIVDNPSLIGGDGLFHAGWRIRQDSLYAMGPLDNLVGMQYRIDHLENLKADVFDLVAAPPLLIKGLVDDFTWGPFARIYVGDDGDVKSFAPEGNVLNANLEISNIMNLMEEMAGSPKEAAGFRTPGEKTAYEVQRLENAAARIFSTKIVQFEEQILEPLLNAMLEMFRRKMTSATLRMFDSELNSTTFMEVTPEDISGSGRIRPMAARNFAERAERVQNLNNFFQSALGSDQDIKAHFSSVKLAYMFEDLLDVKQYEIVTPYVRISEQQEAQQLMNAGQEQTQMAAGAPSGLTPDDTSNLIPQQGAPA